MLPNLQSINEFIRNGLLRANKRLALKKQLWQHLFIILLSFVSVGLLVFELTADLLADQVAIIHSFDLVISMIFLSEFVLSIYRSEDRKQYFTKNWTDLLASIPITGEFYRSLRALQFFRLVRVVRLVVRIKKVASISEKTVKHSSRYIYVVVTAFVVMLLGAMGFFHAEFAANNQVNNFFDAIWWAVVTTTTVGYGDITPITTTGRIIAMSLMIFGVGFMGTMAGLISNYLIDSR